MNKSATPVPAKIIITARNVLEVLAPTLMQDRVGWYDVAKAHEFTDVVSGIHLRGLELLEGAEAQRAAARAMLFPASLAVCTADKAVSDAMLTRIAHIMQSLPADIQQPGSPAMEMVAATTGILEPEMKPLRNLLRVLGGFMPSQAYSY